MKKWISVILCLVLVMLSAACAGQTGAESKAESSKGESSKAQSKSDDDQDTLVVCVENQGFLEYTELKSRIYDYIDLDCDRIVFEALPSESVERQTYCERLRIEIMSGGGPDVFILSSTAIHEGVVFSNMEKTMRGGHFLPLDDYIENWDTDLFEKQTPVIMDAGKTEEGQVVLPLLYTLPLYVVYENETIEKGAPFDTWAKLEEAAKQDETVAMILSENRFHWFPLRFGVLGNYDVEKITLTQETLEDVLEQAVNVEYQESPMDAAMAAAAPDEVIAMEGTEMADMKLQSGMRLGEGGAEELAYQEDRSVLAIYNTEGGLTAQITAFAAVNRNTLHAEDAVKLASVLYNDEFQNLDCYSNFIGMGTGSVPTGENYRYYEQVKPYLDQVNAVRFYSELDYTLAGLPVDTRGKESADLAENGLSKMKMMMAE